MAYLIISLLALALGPALAIAARRVRATTVAVDAFVLVALGGLVLLHILPHSLEGIGLWALPLTGLAFVVTGLAERGLHEGASRASGGSKALLVASLLGLFLHAVVDGVALTGWDLHDHGHGHAHDHGEGGSVWAFAVLVHRVPFAVSLWWIIWPLFGVRVALTTIGVLAAGTVTGWAAGQALLETAPSAVVAAFEAVLAGTLMHVVLHADLPPAPHGSPRVERWGATLLGLLAGTAVVHAASVGHEHASVAGVGEAFLDLALQSAPALLFAYLAVGALHAFVPRDFIARASQGRPLKDALRGVAIGIPLPVCSCGVVPIYRDLVRRGSSAAAGIAFLIATPEIEIAAILLTWELLGPDFAMARVIAAGLLAVGVALVVARAARRTQSAASPPGDEPPLDAPPAATIGERVRSMLTHGFGEAVDGTAAWILVGLGIAAWLVPNLDPEWVTKLSPGLAVPVAALMGLPIYVCASGSTPLVAVLVAKGLSPGAALAFLLTGPATNVTTFGVVRGLHGRRAAVLFAAAVAMGAIMMGWLADALIGGFARSEAGAIHTHSPSALQVVSLGVLTVVVLASVLRRGVRGFLDPLFDAPNLGERGAGSPHPSHEHHGHKCCDS